MSALRKYFHQAAGTTYEELPGERVRVTDRSGRSGLFHANGRYIEGDITQANPHMLMWCGGPRLPDQFRYIWNEAPVDINRPSGWPEALELALNARH